MAKVRIYDLANELSVSPKEILSMLSSIGVANKVASSSVEGTAANGVRQIVANRTGGSSAPASATSTATLEAPKPAPASAAPAPSAPVAPRPPESRPADNAPRSETSNAPTSSAPSSNASAPSAPASGTPTSGASTSGAPQAPRTDSRPASNGGPSHNNGGNRPGGGGGGFRPGGQGGGNRSGGGGFRPGGGQGGNRPPGQGAPPAAGAAPGASGGNRPTGGGARPGRVPQNISDSPFATGSRDRKNARRGKYRGFDRRSRFDQEEEVQEAPLTAAEMRIVVTGEITVAELAQRMRKPVNEIIKALMQMGIMRSGAQALEMDVASNIATKFGFTVEREATRAEGNVIAEENPDELIDVPPVVVVMGHVDHGKTSLLDRIRQAKVQSGEAGGITQRIGAYETVHEGRRFVFLDTPGHEAFTRMRARGAHVTDIAILVVAADDGIMPQTREAIDHARAAKVPIIVAMNKIDKADADPDRVLGQLAEVDLIPESYGGTVVVQPVSAKTGQGVDELLELVGLQADLLELKANPNGLATGTVIEARQDPQRGPVATVLLHRGTMHVGDNIVIGDVYGRVRQMLDYKGTSLEEAGPKTPVFITGLSAVPHASDSLRTLENPRAAREAAEKFSEDSKEGRNAASMRSLADLFAQIKSGAVQELNLIVKADGQGSVEALAASLEKLAHEEVRVKIVSRGVGNITENDVNLASASDAIIIAFSVGMENVARQLADREKVEIRLYDVIYDAINDVKAALEGMLKPLFEEKYSGEAEVRALFKSTKAGVIAGCLVTEGKMIQDGLLRVFRNNKMVFDGKLDSLRHIKSEVKEMTAGQECGISSQRFNDFQVGDKLRCFILEQIKRTLD